MSGKPGATTTTPSRPDVRIPDDFWGTPVPSVPCPQADEVKSLRAMVKAQGKIIEALQDEIRELCYRLDQNV